MLTSPGEFILTSMCVCLEGYATHTERKTVMASVCTCTEEGCTVHVEVEVLCLCACRHMCRHSRCAFPLFVVHVHV